MGQSGGHSSLWGGGKRVTEVLESLSLEEERSKCGQCCRVGASVRCACALSHNTCFLRLTNVALVRGVRPLPTCVFPQKSLRSCWAGDWLRQQPHLALLIRSPFDGAVRCPCPVQQIRSHSSLVEDHGKQTSDCLRTSGGARESLEQMPCPGEVKRKDR